MFIFARPLSALAFLAAVTFASIRGEAATIDTTTQGNWIGVYGSDGYILNGYLGAATPAANANDLASLPSYVSSYSYSSDTNQYVWMTPTTDTRTPENPLAAHPLTDNRTAATAYANGDYSVTLNLSHGESFQLGVYGLDWDNDNGRDITITIGNQSARFNNTTITNAYFDGEWGLFQIHNAPAGPLVINITQNAGSASNSVISAITFDNSIPTPEPSSVILCGLGGVGLLLAARRRRTA